MADLSLTIALERYDRHVPLFMGSVKPPAGLTLRMLEVGMSHPCRDGIGRPVAVEQMFHQSTWDS